MEKYLPLGSIIELKNDTLKIMIIGYQIEDKSHGKKYDYCGCLYPVGLFSLSEILSFNHSDIVKIYAEGYIDESYHEFLDVLNGKYDSIELPKTKNEDIEIF